MNGLSLSQQMQMHEDHPLSSSKSHVKTFNYFEYPTKEKEKPFSHFDYSSLDDSMPYFIEDTPSHNRKYDEIIDRQEKVIDILKKENDALKHKLGQLEEMDLYVPQEVLSICYLLNIQVNENFSYVMLYQAVQGLLGDLSAAQGQTKELEKKLSQSDLKQRENTCNGDRTPRNKNRGGGFIQYKQKVDIPNVQKLQREIMSLKEQINKFKNATPSVPLFVPSVKEKKIEVIVERIVERVVERPVTVQKIVEVEKTVFVDKIVEKPVYFEKKVREQIPIYIERIVERNVEKIVERPTPVYIDREIEVEKLVDRVVYVRSLDGRTSVNTFTQTE